MKKILIIMIITTIGVLADFSRSGNIVTDNSTNLQWQDDDEIGTLTNWQGAIDRCEALSLDGFDDWRLPNKNELISILDYSKSKPSINSKFQNTPYEDMYWSSTSLAIRDSSDEAWDVSFYSPRVGGYNKTAAGDTFRCVRGGEVVANYPTLKSLRPSDDINISIGSAYSIAFEAFDRDIDISSRVSCGTGGYTVYGTEVSYDANFSLDTSYENLYRFSCAVANNQGLVTEINQSIQVLPKNISRSIKESDILLDYTSKLMWEDSFEQTIEDNYLSPSEAVAYCNDLTLGNYIDWRVPSKYEWETMVNFYRSFNKKINYYWTSTAVPNREGYYYNLALFNNSYVEQDYKSYTKCVHDLVEEPVINTTVVFNNGEPLDSQYININDNFEIEDINVSDVNDESITNQSIEVTHNIDNTQRGTYTITYSVTNSLGVTSSIIRKVKVISRPTIELIGDSNITIKLGSEINLGATAYDVVDGNLTYYIEDNESAIDTNQVGEYLIEYWVMNYHGYGATVYRTVTVVAPYPTLNSLRPSDDINTSIGSDYSIAFEAFDGDTDISSRVSCGTDGYIVDGTDIYYNTYFALDTSYAHLYRFNCAVANDLGFVTEVNQSVNVLDKNISHDPINSDVLIDYTTKLMWQDDTTSSGLSLSNAVEYCSSLTLGNYTNWRLPSKYEWETMINFNTSFNNGSTYSFRSNTVVTDNDQYNYLIKLSDNTYTNAYYTSGYYVKCVHDLR